MPSLRFKSLIARAVLSCVGLAAAGASHAAVYGGHWDPTYGVPFPNLGWTADATFDIGNCLSQGDGSCGGVTFLTADVSFYNAGDPTRTLLETYQLMNLGGVSGSVNVVGGQVVGVSSDFFPSFVPDPHGPASGIDGGGDYAFNLILGDDGGLGGTAQLWYSPPGGIEYCGGGEERSEAVLASCGQSNVAAVGTFAAIPEPGSAVLALTSLGLLATVSRRRCRG